MKELNVEKTVAILNEILEYELAGVVRYTHYALMVSGPHRIPIVDFMKAQATESLMHAHQVGEIITGLEGHPSTQIAEIEETHKHAIGTLLRESLNHEQKAVELYVTLLDEVQDASVYLEEFARGQIGQEELHLMELKKMVRDFG
jgi:bacterioferritin